MQQLAFGYEPTDTCTIESKRDLILAVLARNTHRWVGGEEFMDGRHGFRCSSYSQRIGQLVRAGHRIERDRNHGGIARYRMEADDA